jgi:hypothetical protein
MALGFFDGAFTGPQSSEWLSRAATAGSEWVRIDIGWDAPATRRRPVGFHARNPADPHYNFATADAAIRTATADGLKVIAEFSGAPPWAEGKHRPADVTQGSWRPSPRAIEDYAIALGKRYSGHFPDPVDPGRSLPRVAAFQLWNEPNLSEFLTPQWVGQHTAAPELYRAMLNAFYRGLKSVDPSALAVTAGTAPFGDPYPGGPRIMPVRFWRDALCVRNVGRRLRGVRCADPAHFDVLAHQPYSVGAPDTKALNPDDVSIPDLWKLTGVLHAAERTGGVLPHERHPLWVTEVGYNTKPPNPHGVPVAEDAFWVEEALELLWRQGVSVVTWNTIVDQAPVPSYSETSQAGMYFLNGKAKPTLLAFRFPFVAGRARASGLWAWGRAPVAGTLHIERRSHGRWHAVQAFAVRPHETFLSRLAIATPATLRAVVAGQASMVWLQH